MKFSRRVAIWHGSLFLSVCTLLFSLTKAIELPTYHGPVANRDGSFQQFLQGSKYRPPSAILENEPAKQLMNNEIYEDPDTLSVMIDALNTMQDEYFELWQGMWPTAIDWTSAVLGTHIAAALGTLSAAEDYILTPKSTEKPLGNFENLINRYFSQLVSFYFGQDSFSLRNEAYDDMLWVVLGWLDSIRFIKSHSSRHYGVKNGSDSARSPWHGEQWIPSFAHRARLFWDFASKGWDTTLCNGGMVWSPRLGPYKNAITNELFITASISMYLYSPGDDNTAPFISGASIGESIGPQDPKYLKAAIESYRWLISSNMTNEKGLFIDGFHVNKDSKCDVRNEMVYTYNQGVLLSGQRGLWEATGAPSYLEDGHQLISNVINATGYDLERSQPYQDRNSENSEDDIGDWHGIGRRGILEEACDAFGYCSQDGQTFKGIFFHHMAQFCTPLEPQLIKLSEAFNVRKFHYLKLRHENSCAKYTKWIRHNANYALATRDSEGRYGMWWGAPSAKKSRTFKPSSEIPAEAVDYRNSGVPSDEVWKSRKEFGFRNGDKLEPEKKFLDIQDPRWDPNDRGRGRTVETQGGAISVLRALWELAGPEETRYEKRLDT